MSMRVAIGKSKKKDLREAVSEAVHSALFQMPAYSISLVLAFASPEFSSPSLIKNIKNHLHTNAPIIGCSAMGFITSLGIQREGLVLAFLCLPQIKISSGFTTLSRDTNAFLLGQELGKHLIAGNSPLRRELCLLFNDGLAESSSDCISGLQSILGKSFPFIGAGASDNFKFQRTFQYYNDDILHNSSTACLLSGKLNYAIGIRHGWKPLGKIRTVTQSKANMILQIDEENATSLYEGYFAKTLPQLKKEISHINILYPIGIYLPGENEYLLRNVTSLNEDGSITTQGNIPQGSPIRLMIGTKESCLEAASEAAAYVKTALKEKNLSLALIFSSASRLRILGRDAEKEIKIIRDTLGEAVPIAGCYSYGEYAPLAAAGYYGQSYLHNQTILLLGIGA